MQFRLLLALPLQCADLGINLADLFAQITAGANDLLVEDAKTGFQQIDYLIEPIIDPLGKGVHPHLNASNVRFDADDLALQFGLLRTQLRNIRLQHAHVALHAAHPKNRGRSVHQPWPHSITNYHKSSTSRAGSSRHSFTRTRNVTASRPSTTRWS